MPIAHSSPFSLPISRRELFTLGGLPTAALALLGCDLGSMFAVPPRDTVYFTPNDKFYTVNFMDPSYNFTCDLDVEQWQMVVNGSVQNRLVMKWRDLLNRESFDQAVTLMCIDTLSGGTSLGTAMWRGISLKKLLKEVGADEETARDVIFRAADGYHDSISFSRAMEDDVGNRNFKRYFWVIGNVPKKQRRGNHPISGLKMRGLRLRDGPYRSLAKDVTKNCDTFGGFRCVKAEGDCGFRD